MCMSTSFDFLLNIFPFSLNHCFWFCFCFFQGNIIRPHVFLTKWQPVLSKQARVQFGWDPCIDVSGNQIKIELRQLVPGAAQSCLFIGPKGVKSPWSLDLPGLQEDLWDSKMFLFCSDVVLSLLTVSCHSIPGMIPVLETASSIQGLPLAHLPLPLNVISARKFDFFYLCGPQNAST